MKRNIVFVLVVVLVATLTWTAMAQREGQQPRRDGGAISAEERMRIWQNMSEEERTRLREQALQRMGGERPAQARGRLGGRGMSREDQLKSIKAIEAQLAKLKASIEAGPTSRTNFRDMSEEDRGKLRETMMKSREERTKAIAAIEAEVGKLKGPSPAPMTAAQVAELKRIQGLAKEEKAPKTALALETLITRAQRPSAAGIRRPEGAAGARRGGERGARRGGERQGTRQEEKTTDVDWNAKYEQFLKDNPQLKMAIDGGRVTKEQIMQRLKAGSGDARRGERGGITRGDYTRAEGERQRGGQRERTTRKDLAGEPSGKEIKLFNGKDLSGWKFYASEPARLEDVWSVADGLLVSTGSPRGYIYTKELYENFKLVVEWRWPVLPGSARQSAADTRAAAADRGRGRDQGRGRSPAQYRRNSGILMRLTGEHSIFPDSLEAQLAPGDVGAMFGFQGFNIDNDRERTSETGHPGVRISKLQDGENPVGECNRFDITVNGGRATYVLNGVTVNEATGCDVRPGSIALQSEGGVLHFRTVTL